MHHRRQPKATEMLCYFNLAGAEYDADVTGVDLPSIAYARNEAAHYASEVIRTDRTWFGQVKKFARN